jgi:hypothetical protein
VDDKQIINELRGLALAEPLLGFDPDDVATKAAKGVRNRRATLTAGMGTLAVIGAAVTAVTFAVPGPGSAQVAPVGSPQGDLTGKARNRQHLEDVLGKVLTGAEGIGIKAFDNPYGNDLPITTYEVSYRDGTGPASFNLTITAPAASQTMTKLADQCNPSIARRKGLNGKPLRCDKLSQPDGSTVVVEEIASLETDPPALAKVKALDAIHYRTDGSTVNIVNAMLVSVDLAARYGQLQPDGTGRPSMRPKPPLTEQQLITLVTDPAISLE